MSRPRICGGVGRGVGSSAGDFNITWQAGTRISWWRGGVCHKRKADGLSEELLPKAFFITNSTLYTLALTVVLVIEVCRSQKY